MVKEMGNTEESYQQLLQISNAVLEAKIARRSIAALTFQGIAKDKLTTRHELGFRLQRHKSISFKCVRLCIHTHKHIHLYMVLYRYMAGRCYAACSYS